MTDAEQQKRITITLSAEEHFLLRTIAFEQDVPVALKAREAIQGYLERIESMGAFTVHGTPGGHGYGQQLEQARKRFVGEQKSRTSAAASPDPDQHFSEE